MSLISQIKSKTILSPQNLGSVLNGSSICVFNTESVYFFYKNSDYQSYVRGCSHLAIDGAALQLVLRLFCGIKIQRYHGPDLLSDIVSSKNATELRVLIGGQSRSRELVDQGLLDEFVDLPFSSDISSLTSVANSGLEARANTTNGRVFVFVSLGLPKQELVAMALKNEREKNGQKELILIPIGAAVDFLSGHRVRSSTVWTKLGLEWLPRLIREPRMAPRIYRSILGLMILIRRR